MLHTGSCAEARAVCLWIIVLMTLCNDADGAITDVNHIDLPETVITVRDNLPQMFSSPDFPNCCQPVKYLLEKGLTEDRRHWKILFTDLDLPPTSHLLIYGVKEQGTEKVPIVAARYVHGAWIRPVVLYEGYAVSIEFYPAQSHLENFKENDNKTFVGFRGAYWLDHNSWQLDRPFTNCPPIEDAVHGGTVTVTFPDIPLHRQHYRMYCVWLFKPVPGNDLQMYVNIENLDGSDSTIKVHRGLTSTSPMVFSSSRVDTARTFTTKVGFYIELSKPADQSTFTMSFGVHKVLLRSRRCVFQDSGKPTEGFKCEGEDLCIPVENKCDRIEDCSSGHDEMPEICKAASKTMVRNNKTDQELWTGIGEPCNADYHYVCADGSCVMFSEHCQDGSEPCSFEYQRRCQNGSCIPGSELCNGHFYCTDGEDEHWCDRPRAARRTEYGPFKDGKAFLLLLLIPAVILLWCCCHYLWREIKREEPRDPLPMTSGPIISGADHSSSPSWPATGTSASQRNVAVIRNDSSGHWIERRRCQIPPETPSYQMYLPPSLPSSPSSSSSPPDTPPPAAPSAPLPSSSPAAPSAPPPSSPPPSYNEVMTHQDVYLPTH